MSRMQQEAASRTPVPVRVITPHRGWFDWRLGQLWRSRELIGLFVWRDFVAVYAQTVLGPLWHILRPLVTTLLFTLVFGRIVGLSTDGAPAFLFYLVGTVAWSFFAASLDGTARTFLTHAPLLGKVSFHRLVIPVALVLSNLIAFGVQFVIVLVAMGAFAWSGTALHVTPWLLLLPLQLLVLAGFGLGGGIIVCALTTRYRDLALVITFATQSLMYVTPVIYPVSAIPERYRWLAHVNPLSPVFESLRYGLLGTGAVSPAAFALSALSMLVVLTIGLLLFTRADRTFMDTI